MTTIITILLVLSLLAHFVIFCLWLVGKWISEENEKMPVHLCELCSRQLMHDYGVFRRPEERKGFMCTKCKQVAKAEGWTGYQGTGNPDTYKEMPWVSPNAKATRLNND